MASSSVRILTQGDVIATLPMDACIGAMREALLALTRGQATQPLRSVLRAEGATGLLGTMPGYLGGAEKALGAKVITVMPPRAESTIDSHQGVVLLFDPGDGRLLAILDATAITSVRTAAVSAVATDVLSRGESTALALLGSGSQAAAHLEAMRQVRRIGRVRIWSRRPERARHFAARVRERHDLPVEPAATAREAVEGADVVCTVTSAREPVLQGAWMAPGTHVNAVGACVPTARELDTEAVRRARVYVDRRESALAEAGDLLIPIQEGALTGNHIVAEIGEVLAGKAPGRGSETEVTLFKSLGLAVEDLAAARLAYDRAVEAGVGTVIPWEGSRHAGA